MLNLFKFYREVDDDFNNKAQVDFCIILNKEKELRTVTLAKP